MSEWIATPGVLLVVVTAIALAGGQVLTLGASARWTLPILGGYLMGVALMEVQEVVPLAFMAGFFLQIILEHFSGGIEHAHPFRDRHVQPEAHQHTTLYVPVSIVLAVGFHMLVEGMPVGMLAPGELPPWLWGVFAHRALEAFLVMQVLHFAGRKTLLGTGGFLLIVSVISVLGGAWMLDNGWLPDDDIVRLGKSIVLGALLYIGSMLMRETATPAHQYTLWQLLAIAGGALLAVLIHHCSV